MTCTRFQFNFHVGKRLVRLHMLQRKSVRCLVKKRNHTYHTILNVVLEATFTEHTFRMHWRSKVMDLYSFNGLKLAFALFAAQFGMS